MNDRKERFIRVMIVVTALAICVMMLAGATVAVYAIVNVLGG